MRALRGVGILSVLLWAASLIADTVGEPLVFQSLNQSIWGPGGTTSFERRVMLIDPSVAAWNESRSHESIESVGGFDFGGGVNASTSGHIGLWLDLKLTDSGSVNVTYPVTPRIDFPDANSFRAGDTVTVYTSYTFDGHKAWQMATTSPQFAMELDGSFAVNAAASARICVFDCGNITLLPSVGYNPGEFNIFTLRPNSTIAKPAWLDSPLDGSITLPDIQTSATIDGRSLTGAGSDGFLELSIDLADIAFGAAGSPVPPSFDSSDYGSYAVDVRAWYTILRVAPTIEVQARQNFRFDPNLKVTLQFAKTLEYRIGTSGDFLTGNSVEVTVGDSVQVRYPSTDKQPTSIDPTFRLDNTFHSETGLYLEKTIDVEALGAGLEIPSVEIIPEICFGLLGCTPSLDSPTIGVSIPPLYDRDFSLGGHELPDLFNSSWQLGGFTPLTVKAFALDPENPIVTIDQQTGATRNLGGGRRQVAYAIDFGNGGDVKLSDVHLQSDLAGAFAAAHSYKVDQVIGCDVAPNPNFNGGTDKELLASGASLAVGAKARVILIVSVYPKPDPPVYTLTSVDDGTSQLGTLVTKSDSSDVLLGPGIITSADDYVLFGDHFVKLDAIASSFGHVGSNDFVEVKYGSSGIVAGDLRAGRVVRVQGAITADYAIAGSIVDVVGKGSLTLSGNIKQGANVPSHALAAATPSTPLQGNVWVGDNQSKVLQPGHYGDVTVNANAALMLEPGTYSFHKFSVANGALVQVIGSTRKGIIQIVDPGEVRIGQGATVRATLFAPRANVTFEERSRLEGAASAKSITLRPGASASYHFDCDRLVDPDCDGSANCGTL